MNNIVSRRVELKRSLHYFVFPYTGNQKVWNNLNLPGKFPDASPILINISFMSYLLQSPIRFHVIHVTNLLENEHSTRPPVSRLLLQIYHINGNIGNVAKNFNYSIN